MPAASIKRKEPVVKAVRRLATSHLDRVITHLASPKKPKLQAATREALRLQALLLLVRQPLGSEVFTRENRVLTRALRQLQPTPDDLNLKTLATIARASPKIDVQDLLASLQPTKAQIKPARAAHGPNPKWLRLVADLAEVRMRARYWNLPDGGFELLAPGLRRAYQRAAKLAEQPDSPGGFAAALGTFGYQLRVLERSWPEMIEPYRKAVRSAQRTAEQQAALHTLRPRLQNHDALLARLDQRLAELAAPTAGDRSRLFAETPAALTKRFGVYWEAWRG